MKKILLLLLITIILLSVSCRPKENLPPYWLLFLLGGTSTVNSNNSVNNTVNTPQFSPEGGIYDTNESVTITSTTDGATIYYTTDGSNPSISSNKYSTSLSFHVSTFSLKAFATKSGLWDSNIQSADYTYLCGGGNGCPTGTICQSGICQQVCFSDSDCGYEKICNIEVNICQ